MKCSSIKNRSFKESDCQKNPSSTSMFVQEILYTESPVGFHSSSIDSDDSMKPSSSNISLANNQLVLITNDFCTNFPLLKPIDDAYKKERSLFEMGYDNTTVPNWEKIAQPKKEDIKTLLIDIVMRHEKTDIEIIIGDTTFRCHLLVLRCYSEYFNNLTDNPKVVTLPSAEVSPTAFYMVYKWMLSPDPTICRENILDFFKASQYLEIECAASQCWICICDNQFVEDAAMLLYLEARVLGLKDVQVAMANRVCRFFLNLVASKDFLDLNVDEVMHFLMSNSIGVHTEIEVLFSALRWLHSDWEVRSRFRLKLIECVRFGLMTQSQLLLLKRNKEPEVVEIVDDTVKEMIDDGISIQIIKMNKTTQVFRDETIFIEPVQRHWLTEGRVEKSFNYSESASFKTFLQYLRYLRSTEPLHWHSFQHSDSKHPLSQNDREANEKVFGDSMISHPHQADQSFNDTKIIFQSKNYLASDDSSTKSRSKILRYNPANILSMTSLRTRESVSPISVKYLKKRLPLSEFQLMCQHLPSKSFTTSFSTKSNLRSQPCDTILTFGGLNTKAKSSSNDDGRHVYQYVPSKNRWNFVAFMPNSRQYHSAVIFQGRIYIAGGLVMSQTRKVTTNSMLSFDPVTLSWFRETDLPVKVKNFGFVTAHLQIYAIGGEDHSDTPSNLVFRYDPVNASWTELERMHFKRSRAAVAIHKNLIWVAGGLTDNGITDSVEYFNPITGIWKEANTSLRVPRCFARMSSINGGLFIVGGVNEEGVSLASIDVYDEVWETWKQIEDMEIPRFGHEVCNINTCMIIIGGINSATGENVSMVECYCNSKMAWTEEFQKFPFPVTGMAAVILPSCYVISLKS